jgi:hypothetical protein
MLQQAAKLIIKVWKKTQTKEPREQAHGFFTYFNDIENLLAIKNAVKTVDDALCLNNLEKALAVRAGYRIKNTMTQFLKKAEEGVSENERVNTLFAVDIVQMAQSHMIYVAFKIFREAIENPATFKCPNLRTHMLNLARVFAIHELLQ